MLHVSACSELFQGVEDQIPRGLDGPLEDVKSKGQTLVKLRTYFSHIPTEPPLTYVKSYICLKFLCVNFVFYFTHTVHP